MQRLSVLCQRRSAVAVAALLALLLTAPALDLGLVTDDYVHRGFVKAQLALEPAQMRPWEMFGRPPDGPLTGALQVYTGFLPWWTSPSFSLAFFRPLSAITHFVDYLLWPDQPALMHLHNLLWYAGLVLLAGAFYRRLLGPGVIATLALFMYAVDDAHADGAAWIAGRNTLMAAFFSVLTMLLYARARRGESRRAWIWAAVAFALALLSGEGAVAAFGYLIADALWLDGAPLRARYKRLAPFAALLAVYLIAYRALGYGAHGSGVYLDPLGTPVRFALAVVERLPIVLREQFAFPGLVYHALPVAAWPVLDALNLLLLAVCAWPLARLLRHSATSRFFATGLLFAALPICAIGVTPRLLFMVGIGGAGLVAELVATAALASVRAAAARPLRALSGTTAVALLALHLALAPLIAPFAPRLLHSYDEAVRATEVALPTGAELSGKALLLLNVRNYFMTVLAFVYRGADGGPLPRATHVLGSGDAPVRLTRSAHDSLLLEPAGGFLSEPWSWMVRKPDERFRVGQVVLLSEMAVTVEALTDDGRPARVRLRLPSPDDPRLLWMAWSGQQQRFVKVELPKVGQSVVLASVAGERAETPVVPF